MPYLHIKLGITPSPDAVRRIASELTDLTANVLKKNRDLTAVSVECVEAGAWFIGGHSLVEHGLASAYCNVKVTKGTNTKQEKAAFVAAAFDALQRIVGPLHPASYVVVEETDADGWGYQGRTQEYRSVASRLT